MKNDPNNKIKYQFSAKLWRHAPEGGWYFVTIPKEISKEIRTHLQWQEEGWGRMKASATIKDHKWNTSIWFDTKTKNYVLPIKAEVRKKLAIKIDDLLNLSILV